MVVVEIVEGLLLCPNFSRKSALLLTHYKTKGLLLERKTEGEWGRQSLFFKDIGLRTDAGRHLKKRPWKSTKNQLYHFDEISFCQIFPEILTEERTVTYFDELLISLLNIFRLFTDLSAISFELFKLR